MLKILITNIMYVVFPILIYFIAVAYNKSINLKNNRLLLELSLFLSLYFIISFGSDLYTYKPFYLLYIPLLIGYLKKRNSSCLLISLILIIYLRNYLYFNLYILIINFIILFLVYKFIKKNFTLFYTLINVLFIYLYIGFSYNYVIIIINYLITSFSVVLILCYIDSLMNFYMTLKDIEKDKKLQESLFKISHEVKNPIAVCKGYLELMDGSIEKYNKYVPIINEEINHSLSILKDFSTLGKLEINKEFMDIGLLIEEVIDNFKSLFEQNKIELDYSSIYDEIYIQGDYTRLKQVIINVIKNAVEAMYKINNPKLRIVIEVKNEKVLLHFIDNGIGIDEENIKRISEPFFTTKSNGTGLGTYLSKEIIDGHNGSINYFSKKGRGMHVLIKLNVETI